ncbi:PAS domain S-box protein [bacterium]|nr:MAG: PAS domain S-box protein [bacterium]
MSSLEDLAKSGLNSALSAKGNHAPLRPELLDVPIEDVLDRYSALASKMLGTPIVLVTIVEENRQYFQGQSGLPEPLATRRETPLSHSICKYVVANRVPLVVADARSEKWLAENPGVTDLGVVAYAGVPLLTREGETIGSVCAVDHEPHCWTSHEIDILNEFAQIVMREIDLCQNARQSKLESGRVERILESITDAFFQLDREYHFTYVNDQALRILGRPREELLRQNIWTEFPDAVDSTFAQEFQRAAQTGETINLEEFYRPLGIWVDARIYPNDDGLSVYFQDITARKNAEKRLLLLESVVVHANDTVIITDAHPLDEPGPRIIYVNEAFTRMTGYTAEEALGQSPRFLQGKGTEREPLDILRQGLERSESTNIELLNYRKDGQAYWTEMSVVPILDAQGQSTHFISIQRDITQRRQVREVLQQARDEAERANQAKSEFLSRMSHELRTPLNAILGFGQLLELSSLSERDEECVDQILKGGEHLLTLINEVLDIARIESGQLSLSMEPVEATPLCHEVLALVRAMAEQRGIAIKHHTPACPYYVLADQQRIKQILLNLLSNAIKYNRPGGSVTLECEVVRESYLRFKVRDEGIGIPLDKQDRVFLPFDRLEVEKRTPGQTPIEGTGIGLALSLRLAEAMGGTLGFDSLVGVGSTFWLEVALTEDSLAQIDRVAKQHALHPTGERYDDASRRLVLYIEDNLSNLRLIERLLEEHHLQVLGTQQGQLGLDLAREQGPDLILLDLNLPDISGEEVLKKLRADPRTNAIPVVMLSADASPRQVTSLLEAGAKAYLTKPINVREFYNTIDGLLDVIQS